MVKFIFASTSERNYDANNQESHDSAADFSDKPGQTVQTLEQQKD